MEGRSREGIDDAERRAIEHLTADGRVLKVRQGAKRYRYFLSDGTAWRGEMITLAREGDLWFSQVAAWIRGGGWAHNHHWRGRRRCQGHGTRAEALVCAEQQLPAHRWYADNAGLEMTYRREGRRRRDARRAARVGPGWQRMRLHVLREEPICRRAGRQPPMSTTSCQHFAVDHRTGRTCRRYALPAINQRPSATDRTSTSARISTDIVRSSASTRALIYTARSGCAASTPR